MHAKLFLVPFAAVLACDSANQATEASKKAAAGAVDASKALADDASNKAADASKKAVESTTKAASDAIDASKKAAVDATGKLWADIPTTGELSEQSQAWLAKAAQEGGRSIENLLVEGDRSAPEALQIAKGLASAVDGDRGFEPIFVKVDDAKEADAKIGDMPKVQVVDGLTIGLKRVDAWEGLTQHKERGYLVLWREGDHLVGFVYRSRREIDIEKVAAQAPRLVALVRTATADAPAPQ